MLENLRLERQASKIEQNNIEKQVSDLDGNLSKIKERLDKNKFAENYASELEEIEVKITRLGAINLVAMEEFEQETERKALL